MKLLFEGKFENGNSFKEELFTGGWENLVDHPIKELIVHFLNRKIKLENFQEYNILVERCAVFGRGTKISKIFVIGRKEFESSVFEFNLIKKAVFYKVKTKYLEFNGELVKGWKLGVKGLEAKVYSN